MSPSQAICGGVNGGVSNSDPLLSAVVSEGAVAGKQMQEWTLLLQATCPLPEQDEASKAGSLFPTDRCCCL